MIEEDQPQKQLFQKPLSLRSYVYYTFTITTHEGIKVRQLFHRKAFCIS